jgi:hypothetical protein
VATGAHRRRLLVVGTLAVLAGGLVPRAASAASVVGHGKVVGGPVFAGSHVMWIERGSGGRDRVMVGTPGQPARQIYRFDGVYPDSRYTLSGSASYAAVTRISYGHTGHLGETPRLAADVYAGPLGGPLGPVPGCHNQPADPAAQISGSVLATAGCAQDGASVGLTDLRTGHTTATPAVALRELAAAGPYVAYSNYGDIGPIPNRITVLNAATGDPVYTLDEATERPFINYGFQLQSSGAIAVSQLATPSCSPTAVATPAHPHLTPVPGLCNMLLGGRADGDRILMEAFTPPPSEWVADLGGHTLARRVPAHARGPHNESLLAVRGNQITYAAAACDNPPVILTSLTDLPRGPARPHCNPQLAARPRLIGSELRLRLTCPHSCGAHVTTIKLNRAVKPFPARRRYIRPSGVGVAAPPGRRRRVVIPLRAGERRRACAARTVSIRTLDRFRHAVVLSLDGRRRIPLLTPDC